jgi:PEP-CTERM motif
MKFRTVRPGWQSPVTLACALALAAPLAQAQVQATATLSNLSVTVQDLNTADKIKPAATWGGELHVPQDGSLLPMASVLGGEPASLVTNAYSTGSYGQGQISLNTTLGAEALQNAKELPGVYTYQRNELYEGRAVNPATGLMTRYVDVVDETYVSVYSQLGQGVASGYGSEDLGYPLVTLTLAPGTLAVVSGDMLASVTTDSRWLNSFAQQLGMQTVNTGYTDGLLASVSSRIDLNLENFSVVPGPNGGSTTTRQFDATTVETNDQFDTDGDPVWSESTQDPLSVTSTYGKSFSLVVQNWSNQDMVFNLNMTQAVAVNIDGRYSNYQSTRNWDLASGVPVDGVTPPVPNIPEPGTWMLMAMGMAGVVWARQRRSHSNA